MLTVYQRVLRERFDLLHPALRRFLGTEGGGRASGRLQVMRPGGRLHNLVASLLGIPPTGEYDVHLEVTSCGGAQRWVRRFGGHTLETIQKDQRGLLVESSGPASIGFELAVRDGGLAFQRRRAWVLGIRLPLWLVPDIEAENRASESDGWWVRVRFRVPLLGQVGQYEGEVIQERTATSGAESRISPSSPGEGA